MNAYKNLRFSKTLVIIIFFWNSDPFLDVHVDYWKTESQFYSHF